MQIARRPAQKTSGLKERLSCYATGNDIDWYQELGFHAFKRAWPSGPAAGLDGLRKHQELVARTREHIGDEQESMLDCWMAFDVEYSVSLAEMLRPCGLRWLEKCSIPEDVAAHVARCQRLPGQTLATDEHRYTHLPFLWAITQTVIDFLQRDLTWCGGLTTCRKIAAAAEAVGIRAILHDGNTAFR